nr:hypothetical protein ISGA_10895 [Gordonia sp. NB41Y]
MPDDIQRWCLLDDSVDCRERAPSSRQQRGGTSIEFRSCRRYAKGAIRSDEQLQIEICLQLPERCGKPLLGDEQLFSRHA